MNYVIIGGAGHISRPIVETLLKAGHTVTVIGRNAEHLKSLTDGGAKAAIGSVEDRDFLTQTFTGADAVYTMVPPNWNPTDWKAYIGGIGKNYAEAIRAAGVKYVVNLSSVGADKAEGCGPVSGLYRVEQALNELEGVNVLHLRPAFFFYNFLGNAGMVKHMNIIGGNYGSADQEMVLADTNDIAEIAAEELLNRNFTGKTVRYIASQELKAGEITRIIGEAVGKPELPWIEFNDTDNLNGLIGAGISEEVARNYTEMGTAIRSGHMMEDYYKNRPSQLGKGRFEDFAKSTFAAVYAGA
jgi:uncharacterized protein YbjT (DUF2867 family)